MVIVADTNVWARSFLGDEPRQSIRARKALATARNHEGVFIPLVVMAELSWVLRSAGWERVRVLKTVESLLHTRGVTSESPQLVQEAIDNTRKGRGGFADHLITAVGFAQGCREALTFDVRFAKTPKVRLLD
jgi:predicted nucleic-acid-binding protein